MPPDESVDSSPATETNTPAGGVPANNSGETTQTATPGGYEGQGQKPAGSIVDAVTSALKPKADGEGSPTSQTQDSTPKADGSAKGPQGQEEQLPEEVSEDELKDQKPKTRKRIEQLLGKVKGLSTENESLKPKAQEFDRLVNFISANKLSTEDVDHGFELMALMKSGDYVKALDRLAPIYQQLQRLAGEVIPDDLSERVRLGYISEQDARELHRSRTRADLSEKRSEQDRARTAEQRETERRQGIVKDVSAAIASWETAKKTSDPDWHLKSQRIEELVRLEVYEKGYPQTKDAAIKMVNAIHEAVTKEIRKFVPAPQQKTPATPGSSSQTVAEPKSLLEAIRLGLSK